MLEGRRPRSRSKHRQSVTAWSGDDLKHPSQDPGFVRIPQPDGYDLAPGCDHSVGRTMAGMKLKLDLHDIYNRGGDIDRALRAIINEAVAKRAPLVEIIPGKGSGALKKRVLRFLEQRKIKSQYHRVEKDSNNFGRVLVHFRWK